MSVLKFKNPKYVEGGTEEKWITLPTGGGIEDAPEDGKQYVRKDGGWDEVEITDEVEVTGGEAPAEAAIWIDTSEEPEGTIGIKDAPRDGSQYVRQDGVWAPVEIPEDTGGAYPIAEHGTGDTDLALAPNTFHVWGEVTSLTLTFGDEIEGVVNEYVFQFTSGETATMLTLPDTLKWENSIPPSVKSNNTYRFSIIDGLASVESWSLGNNPHLYFEALEDGMTVSFSTDGIQYCLDGMSEWNTLSAGSTTPVLSAGDRVYFKATLIPANSSDNMGIGAFSISSKCNVGGNVMSLLYGDAFEGRTDLSGYDYAFYNLFYGQTNIIDSSELLLPATTLADYCYANMFRDCTALTAAPELPATTLAVRCYGNMFRTCTALVTAPELPATTLTNYCYYYMFCGCTALTTAPELPAATLKDYCYSFMFNSCTSLSHIKMLATNISAASCLGAWVAYVASSGTFVKNSSMTSLPTGTSGIPEGWTVQNA